MIYDDEQRFTNIVRNVRGWSTNGTLITRNTSKLISLQAQFPEPGYYTVQFGVNVPFNPAAGSAPYDAIATIDFKVQGNQIRRIVSVGNGVSISGPGEAIAVSVNDISVAPVPAGVEYNVTVQVTKGVRANTQIPVPLYWSYPPGVGFNTSQVLAPHTAINAIVPPNAGVISVEVKALDTTANTTDVDISIIMNNGVNQLKLYRIVGGENNGFISIPPLTNTVQIINNSATDNISVEATWGIDG